MKWEYDEESLALELHGGRRDELGGNIYGCILHC